MNASQMLQELHNREQADIEALNQWQRIEYAIARRIMTHADAMIQAKQ